MVQGHTCPRQYWPVSCISTGLEKLRGSQQRLWRGGEAGDIVHLWGTIVNDNHFIPGPEPADDDGGTPEIS